MYSPDPPAFNPTGYTALAPFFRIGQEGVSGLVDGPRQLTPPTAVPGLRG